MNLQRPLLLAAVLIAATAAVGVWAYATLPVGATIPVHFNAHGDPDGFMAKAPGLMLMPLIGAAVILALAFAPRDRGRGAGLAESAAAYGVVLIGVAAMFLVSEAAIAMRAMDPDFDVIRWLFLAIGILFVVTGNLLGKIRHNPLFGIRTPWTLKDKRVWDKTHRFTGRLMVLAGVALAAVAFLGGDHGDLIFVLIACAAGPPIAGAIYSRAIWRPAAES
jgi:uncharacterized membrane protein